MQLLTRTYRHFRQLLGQNAWFTGAIVAGLIGLEIAGRQGTSDWHDAIHLLLLLFLSVLILIRHRQRPLAWVDTLVGFLRRGARLLGRPAFEIGIDLRGTPALPQGYPPIVLTMVLVLSAWTVGVLIFVDSFPADARQFLARIWYLGYLLLLGAFWALLIFCTVVAMIVPAAMIHDRFVSSYTGDGRRSRRTEYLCLGAYFGGLVVLSGLLPVWVPLAACILALVVNLVTIVLPSNPDVKFLWRTRGAAEIRSIPWGRWVACEFTLVTLLVINLVLMSCGSVLPAGSVAAAFDKMAITTTLGVVLAWLAPGALCGLVLQTVLGRSRDPARPCRPLLHVAGKMVAPQRRKLAAIFTARGWDVRFAPAMPGPDDVCVEVSEERVAVDADDSVRWPLRVSVKELGTDEMLDRLARRDEIQKRRRLVGGLERLFKRAVRRRRRSGSGLWVAPHYWFVLGLSRDAQGEEWDMEESTILTGIIGLPYHRVLPRAVRHYFYKMMRALQVDLIFVEDGVGFRRFVRVLRLMFEVYDMFGGKRRADEIHFTGVPGTRVLIHDYVLTEPFKSDVYPEPDYENLGRARIMHIFKDRGEQPEILETPWDITHMPVPSLAR